MNDKGVREDFGVLQGGYTVDIYIAVADRKSNAVKVFTCDKKAFPL